MSEYVDPTIYPKAKYKKDDPASPALVVSPSEEESLGEGWVDHPDAVYVAPKKPSKKEVKEPDVKVE